MNFEGKITKKWTLQQVWKNNLDKISLLLEEVNDKEYKASIKVDFLKDIAREVNENYKKWMHVSVDLNSRVSEYNWKYYNNITWWRINQTKTDEQSTPLDTAQDLPF